MTGILIYLLFRGNELLKIDPFIITSNKNFIYSFILYNVPDGLWLYSLLVAFKLIWKEQLFINGRYWVYSMFIAAISSEFAQKLKIIPGTFDIIDIEIYTFTFYFFIYINTPLEYQKSTSI